MGSRARARACVYDLRGLLTSRARRGAAATVEGCAVGVDDSGKGRSANFVDFDGDGNLDLYVVNGGPAPSPNVLYQNNGDGTMSDVTATYGVEASGSGGVNSAAWADVDGDGDIDLYVTTAVAGSSNYLLINNEAVTTTLFVRPTTEVVNASFTRVHRYVA